MHALPQSEEKAAAGGSPVGVTTPEAPPAAPASIDPGLSAAQLAAVYHGSARPGSCAPLLIIAGAGSGKTKTLAARVARLILEGADPQRLLVMTFSRRAAAELERRCGQVLHTALKIGSASRAPALPWSGTFHSVGARLLREYAPRIGLNESFTVHDRADAADLLGLARHELGFSETQNRFPTKDTCLGIYSRTVNSRKDLEEVLALAYPWCAAWHAELRQLFRRYVQEKIAQNVLDYDDLLLYWAEMVGDARLSEEIGGRFDHILVDEYQDTNRLQAAILTAMKPDGQGLTVVGDDAQAIYSFRAADVRNILDFPEQFEPAAARVTLEENYRSSAPILAASNAVIGLARERFAKNLWSARTHGVLPRLVMVRDEADQARFVADEVLALREGGVALRGQAVLFRTSSHSAPLELELARRNIPFVKFGGLKFLEAAHIKDVLALLRWAENPQCRLAGFRALQLLPGVGPKTASRIVEAVAIATDAAAALAESTQRNPSCAALHELCETYRILRQGRAAWPSDFELACKWYDPQLERLYDDAAARRLDLGQLAQIASTYGSRERFLTELTLDPPAATSDESGVPHRDEDYLILSTIHSAKGQEWKAVYVLNLVDGCIPSDMATGTAEEIEEERRLLYVAMTRAKDSLQLVVPQRFYVHQQAHQGDRHVYGQRSRFVPDGLVGLFETRTWPAAVLREVPTGPRSSAHQVALDVAQRLSSRWD